VFYEAKRRLESRIFQQSVPLLYCFSSRFYKNMIRGRGGAPILNELATTREIDDRMAPGFAALPSQESPDERAPDLSGASRNRHAFTFAGMRPLGPMRMMAVARRYMEQTAV
jgi:hypothetical protein